MNPERRYPVLSSLLSTFPKPQRKTSGLILAAILEVAQARSFALAQHLSQKLHIRVDSALNRFYRFLRNPRFDEYKLTAAMLKLLPACGAWLLIAIDWTEWHSEMRMLTASAAVGKRAIPVSCAAFLRDPPRSQNCRENTFLKMLSRVLKELGLRAVFLCDRGFRRASWLRLLQQLGQDYVVRLQGKVTVTFADGERCLLIDLPLAPGQQRDLGKVRLRSDGIVLTRVVCLWAKGQKEPWYLATSLRKAPLELARLYDKRMSIEEQFRDTKGSRFGLKLEWTQFRTPEYLQRFALLLGVAMLLWTAAGKQIAEELPDTRLSCPKKGPRLSLLSIGIAWLKELHRSVKLTASWLIDHLPPPLLNYFDPLTPLLIGAKK